MLGVQLLLAAAAIGLVAWAVSALRYSEPVSPHSVRVVSTGTREALARAEGSERATPPDSSDRVAAGEAEASQASGGRTLIKVIVIDANGESPSTGHVICEWPAHGTMTGRTGNTVLTRALDPGDGSVIFELPTDALMARVSALVSSRFPDQETLRFMRHPNGKWAGPAEEVVYEVVLGLDAETDRIRLQGEVYVEGERRIPRNLRVLPIAEGLRPAPAIIDTVSSRYYWSSPEVVPRALWVVSDETEPIQVPVRLQGGSTPTTLDLYCSLGTSVEVQVVPSSTCPAAEPANVAVELECVTFVERVGRKLQYRSIFKDQTTDEWGRASFSGLPKTGYLSLKLSSPQSGLAARLLKYELEEVLATDGRIEVTLCDETVRFRVSGPLPRAETWPDLDADLRTRIMYEAVQDTGRSQAFDAKIDNGEWLFNGAQDRHYRVWLEQERARLSEFTTVEVASSDVLDVRLQPISYQDVIVVWDGAPDRCSLEATAILDGRRVTAPVRMEDMDSSGELLVRASPGSRLELRLERSDWEKYQAHTVRGPWPQRVRVEFPSQRSVDLRINGHPPQGPGLLFLQEFGDGHGADRSVVRPAMEGGSADGVPLAPGQYFYRYVAEQDPGLIVGICTAGNRGDGRLRIDWVGRREAVKALGQELEPGDVIALQSVGDVGLSNRVDASLLQFLLTEEAAGKEEGLWFNRHLYGFGHK